MSGLLLHTLVWTGVLIAAVLLLRRSVGRMFGPQVAYALWALPLLRLFLPSVTLPAWMAPPVPVSPVPAEALSVKAPIVWRAVADVAPATTAFVQTAQSAGFDLLAAFADVPLVDALVLVWLGGAAVFVWRRFAAYFDLRDKLLTEGREVGQIVGLTGSIRLIETPATTAPLAMGVLDRVIALPIGFMALSDRRARDLALAHELAHHRGGDLLVNMLVQPLFALHWFNPLAGFGWLALRRDQEAACDARVMASRTPDERAAYAAVIANYAAAPGVASHAALSAPMACPVLGEKSIIHRLRSLSMSNLSLRRRMAGRVLLSAGLLALPLTASISYAGSEFAQAAPAASDPPAPIPDSDTPTASQPSVARDASITAFLVTTDDPADDGDPGEKGNSKRTVIIRDLSADGADGDGIKVRIVRKFEWDGKSVSADIDKPDRMSAQDREALLSALREGLAEANGISADLPRILGEAFAASGGDGAGVPRVIMMNNCVNTGGEPMETITNRDGKKTILFCQSRVIATALQGLEEARAEVAGDKDIPEDTRNQTLKALDRQIARWKEKHG